LPGDAALVKVEMAVATSDGWQLFVEAEPGSYRKVLLSEGEAEQVAIISEDGEAEPAVVLAGFWAEWMRAATLEAKATTLATTPLRPYVHQTNAVYGSMLPQPRLRFLLADEPGTGKTIMAGMYLREMQRLGFVRRGLVICPAHLVEKWREDFKRFFGGGLRRITAATVREGALAVDHDLWVTSLDLASVNTMVQEAIRPDRAGWDVVVIDEAHRMTLSAQAYYQLGRLMSQAPRVLLMTATPHRGKESLFRGLLHLVDPDVFPPVEEGDELGRQLKPGSVHFLRRMKEDLVDYDGVTRLFKGRRAQNIPVALNATEQAFYDQSLGLVDRYFPPNAVTLAKMVYGKRAASSLYALRETLKRRRDVMGSDSPTHAAMLVDPESEDDPERDLARVVVEQSLSARAEKDELKTAIRQLDDVLASSDLHVSKWPRMVKECLEANGILPGNGMQFVVFTEFADTADWLLKRFRDAGYSAERYSGRDTDEDREAVRRRFAERDFQVIVSTDAGNEGIDLQTAHVLLNWDIPWSLVRLEQRMGRIHRVGQTRDVELYNLFATGTREGQVLEVLLTNFVIAANQLDGKMFDSLSLLAELVNLDFEHTLARTYDSPERAAAALATATSVSAQRLADAARRASAEEDALRSAVDIAQAVAALQEETLERINPRIVEAFLSRLASGGLLKVASHAAGPGIFVLTPGEGAAIPLSSPSKSRMLVATSGAALENARAAGADVSAAIPLGPSDPAFRSIVDAAEDSTGPALFQGGPLRDRSSVTDYTLFAYDTDITEFGGQRRSTWPFLIRVDGTGARRLRWEWLANLEPDEPHPTALHPGRVLDADLQASEVTTVERSRRAEVLDAWMKGAVAELERLPSALTSHIDDSATRVAARKRVESAVAERLSELARMAVVEVGEPRRLGWATVTAAGAPISPVDADSEEIAMRHTAELLRGAGWSVADVHLEGRGYDLLARKGREQRSVEVKGVWSSASAQGVRMTGHELLIARQLGPGYWLYVVDQCQDGTGRMFGAYQDPSDRFDDLMKDLTVVAVPGSALVSGNLGDSAT
jgi:superfamily II DNA or RNA helicase